MAKTSDQQKTLDHIWHHLHEEQNRSGEAAALAREHRTKESDPTSEMALELAAMQFATAGAAAKQSTSFEQAQPFLQQAAAVAVETFPLGVDEVTARMRGNAWDKVYGSQNAQMEILRNYYHFVVRLSQILPGEEFEVYAQSLWKVLQTLTQEFSDETSVYMLQIEHDAYPQAKEAFEKFLAGLEQKKIADPSRRITVASRMLNRALCEADYATVLKAFAVAVRALEKDRTKLQHFVRQVANSINKAGNSVVEAKKFASWKAVAANHDLTQFAKLLELTQIGLGQNRVTSV